jgi:hypothetical protein
LSGSRFKISEKQLLPNGQEFTKNADFTPWGMSKNSLEKKLSADAPTN